MAATETPSLRPRLLWRMAFWGIAVHFALFSLVIAVYVLDEASAQTLSVFPLGAVGLARAVALWVHVNTVWIWVVPLTSDLVLLWLCQRLAYGHQSSRLSLFFPLTIVGILVSHVLAQVYLVHCGALQTPRTTYVFDWDSSAGFALYDLWLGIPALFFLIARVIRPTTSQTGFCCKCGYDLRASKDRCPECGTPVPVQTAGSGKA